MIGTIAGLVGAALIVSLYYLRKWFAGNDCHCTGRLDGKTVIITGGNSGIGKETGLILAAKGARIVLACRNLESAKAVAEEIKLQTQNESVVAMKMDLASFDSIKTFTEDFLKKESRLDILINNAGVYYHPQQKTENGFDLVYQTNFLGHFLLTYLLMNRIKDCAPSRIINVSSVAYRLYPEVEYKGEIYCNNIERCKYDRNFVYAKSKLAQIRFTKYLANELKGSGVTVNALHPGMVHSGMFRHFPKLSHPVLGKLSWPLLKLTFKTPWQGAQTTVHCAVSEECATLTGQYFKDCCVFPLEELAENEAMVKAIYTTSRDMCGFFDT